MVVVFVPEGNPHRALGSRSRAVVPSATALPAGPTQRRMLGSWSAIDWIIDRYQVKTDRGASGIVNDPKDWADEQGNPRCILDLLARVVTASVETMRIVKSLPPLHAVDE